MRGMIASRLNNLLYRRTGSEGEKYHLWYYHSNVWQKTSWMGVMTYKSPSDMWNYQEIIWSRKPSLLIEFGTACGGSALFFACVMRQIGRPFKILSVDINSDRIDEKVRNDPNIELITISSVHKRVADRIQLLRRQFPGGAFAILDSDHRKSHVLAEMRILRPLLRSGDYLIVEDSNINGHPVNPGWGAGPYEAIQEYFRLFPGDYVHDHERENKFGFTFAPDGFLIRA